MTKHDFQSYGWDNYDCKYCGVSGYTAKFHYCEDEPDFKKTYMYRKQVEEKERTVKMTLTPAKSDEQNESFVKDLLQVLRKHKYIP
jgi:hypothetical protein